MANPQREEEPGREARVPFQYQALQLALVGPRSGGFRSALSAQSPFRVGWFRGFLAPGWLRTRFLFDGNPPFVSPKTPELVLAHRQGRRYVTRLARLADEIEQHLEALNEQDVAKIEEALQRLSVTTTLALARLRACVAIRTQKRRRLERQRERRRRAREAKENDFSEILRRAAREVGRSGAFEESPR